MSVDLLVVDGAKFDYCGTLRACVFTGRPDGNAFMKGAEQAGCL